MNQSLANSYESRSGRAHGIQQSFVTARIAGQRIGIPIAEVQDVLNKQKIHNIPLSPPAVVGALNLRGRIVTALDLRLCLNLEPCAAPESAMSIVVEYENELYSLLVDEIGDVETPPSHLYERPPSNARTCLADCLFRCLPHGRSAAADAGYRELTGSHCRRSG